MTVFEELLQLDRPFLDLKLKIAGRELEVLARRMNAADQDALDAFRSDEYARLVIEYTEPQSGKQSELDRVRQVYKMLSRHELLEQLLGTRSDQIQERALALSGLEASQVSQHFASLTDEAEKAAYQNEVEEALRASRSAAKEEFALEYQTKTDDELADIMAQVNVNVKANQEAMIRQNARRLYYQVYTSEKERFFPSVESVMEFSRESVIVWLKAVDAAFNEWLLKQLPFESQDGQEPDGPLPSSSTSEAATKTGGKRTRTSRKG